MDHPKYWLGFGGFFSLLIFALIVVAFMAPENSCDRWTLLRYILPLFCGIAAGAFVGAISAKGNVNQLVVSATGGFAVWLITLLAVGVPDRCKEVKLSHFAFFENTEVMGDPGDKTLTKLLRKEGVFEVPSKIENFVFFVGAVGGNLHWAGGSGEIELEIEIKGLNRDGGAAWTTSKIYRALGAGDIPSKFSAATIENAYRYPGLLHAKDEGKIGFVMAIECFEPQEFNDWTGAIEVRAHDHKSGLKKVLVGEKLQFRNKPIVTQDAPCKKPV